MLRWFKDRKKPKKTSHVNLHNDYGFKDADDVSGDCDVNDDYDVNLNAKDYHVYEEIGDIPASCLSVTCTNGQNQHTHNTDGPYMIVPIPEVHICAQNDDSHTRSRDSMFTCALIGRRNSSMSGNTENSSSGVDLTYDLADSQKYYPMGIDSLNLNNTQVCVSPEKHSGHCREQSLLASSDTGCEYDISTSSEGDPTSYEFYLARIEQNLAHKCKIREIIQQVTPINEESDSDSMTTVSSVSMTSHRRPIVTQSYSDDEGTLADYSESENSSGYYETEFKSRFTKTAACQLVKFGGCCDTCKRHSDGVRHRSTRMIDTHAQKRCSCGSSCKARDNTKGNVFEQGFKQKHKTRRRQNSTERNTENISVPETNCLSKHNHTGDPTPKSKSRKQTEINSRRYKSKPNLTVTSDCHGNELLSHIDSCLDNSNLKPGESKRNVQLELYSERTDNSKTNGNVVLPRAYNAEEYEYREVYSGNVSDIRTRKACLSNKVAKCRNFDSVDIYKSRTSNNRLLSDLIINNYHERQLLFG